MKFYTRRSTLIAAFILIPLLLSSVGPAFANDRFKSSQWTHRNYEYFTRKPANSQDPAGNTVEKNCSGNYEDYPDATARIRVKDNILGSKVTILIRRARPNTLYTYWLRLKGSDGASVSFGGSPLTNGGSTPLAASWSLYELLQATGSDNGKAYVANGVTTNGRGNAKLRIQLDFPLFGGAYPFQNMHGFDAQDPRYPESVESPSIYPVAIVDPRDPGIDAPFLIRMVSHCTDELGHGLTPGNREPWFDYP